MWLYILLILGGLLLLQRGAAWFVNGSSALARKLQVSELTIGLTIVAFGTSAPEMVVNTFTAYDNNHDLVFGNIIGSNIFNLFVILSIVGLIRPVKVQSSTAWREIPMSLISLLLLFIMVNDELIFQKNSSRLSLLESVFFLIAFIGFLVYIYKHLRTEKDILDIKDPQESNFKILVLILSGLAGLVIGGKLMVDNAVKLALESGMSEKMVGLLILAPGTSLPELATSIAAIIKNKSDIAVGNIIGSNIFNILFILPVSAFIKPLSYNISFNYDIGILVIGSVILFIAMYTGKKKQIDRWEAFILLGCYIVYMIRML
jgi:cation:H+ antiporter